MHPFPSGARIKDYPLTLTKVDGPFKVLGYQSKIVEKFRYYFTDSEGNEFQWWTQSSLGNLPVSTAVKASFTTSVLSSTHTEIQRLRLCRESPTT